MEDGRVVRLPDEYEHPRRWWQNPKWIGAIAAVLFAVGNLGWAATSVKTQMTLESRAKVGDEILAVAQKLDKNQEGIDTLVAFVNKVIADQAKAGQDTTLSTLYEALCSTSDPIQVAACKRLQSEGKIPATFTPGG